MMMMARPNWRAVAGTTAAIAAPSRTCRCQSSGRVKSGIAHGGRFSPDHLATEPRQPLASVMTGDQCCRIFERKSLARGERASGCRRTRPSCSPSTILPASMKMTRWADLLREAHLVRDDHHRHALPWRGRPSRRAPRRPSRGRAPRSARRTASRSGPWTARAIATRCCWPPESWPGNLSLCAIRPTRSSIFRPRVWPPRRCGRAP